MNLSRLETALLVVLLALLAVTSIYAENMTSTNSTTSSPDQIIDQDFINTLITLSPALFFLSICFKFLDLIKELLSFGGEK